MVTLPKILYIFRTVPIPLLAHFFTALNTYLRTFIWKGTQARISFSILVKHRSRVGMGVPVIRNYYRAALLDQLTAWMDPVPTKQRAVIEQVIIKGINLQALLIAVATNHPVYLSDHPSVNASLTTWKDLLSMNNEQVQVSGLNIPLQTFELFIPDFSVQPWVEKRYATLAALPDDIKQKDVFKL